MARPFFVATVLITLLIAAVVAGLLVLGRDGRSSDERAVETALRAYENAVRRHDVETFRSLTTEAYFKRQLAVGGPAGTPANDEDDFFLGTPMQRRIESVSVSGDTATVLARAPGADAKNSDGVRIGLVRNEGKWRLDEISMRKLDLPSGAQVIDISLTDFNFQPAVPDISAGHPVVLRARNLGAQPHMIGIWLVPDGYDLIKIIEATDVLPPGTERFVQSQTFASGEEGDVVVPGGLKPGRYMFTCFLNDITSPILTPHYDLGMLSEFRVP